MWGKICVLDIKRVKIPLQIYPLEENVLWCLERQNTRNLGPWIYEQCSFVYCFFAFVCKLIF